MGLEPTHPKAYAPQTYVSTIPPPEHYFWEESMESYEESLSAILVHPVGFEPTTNGFEDRYSSNWAMGAFLSYLEASTRIIEKEGKNASKK